MIPISIFSSSSSRSDQTSIILQSDFNPTSKLSSSQSSTSFNPSTFNFRDHLLNRLPPFPYLRRLLLLATLILSTLTLVLRSPSNSLHLLRLSSCPPLIIHPRPYTILGPSADHAFDSIGSLCLPEYRAQLDNFCLQAFPKHEQDLNQPNSTRSRMNRYLSSSLVRPLNQSQTNLPNPQPIPRVIHQTNRERDFVPSKPHGGGILVWDPSSWERLNPQWTYLQSDDIEEQAWVTRSLGSEHESSLLRAWLALENEPVMRADLWRYLKIALVGGVYADMDTRCLQPVERWMEWQDQPAGTSLHWAADVSSPPSMIVGIEADVGERGDWETWWPRPIQLVQWTFAAAPGHPILIDTLRRLVSSLDLDPSSLTRSRIFSDANIESEAQRIMRVVRSSGPGPFTDAVLRYVGALTQGEVVWSSLRNVPPNGLRIGDILVLPISGFSPGIRMMGAEEIDYEGAYVHHGFAGTWKSKKPN